MKETTCPTIYKICLCRFPISAEKEFGFSANLFPVSTE
jgi:hypothetical protein